MQKRMLQYGRNGGRNAKANRGKDALGETSNMEGLFGDTDASQIINSIDDKEAYEREVFGTTISSKV